MSNMESKRYETMTGRFTKAEKKEVLRVAKRGGSLFVREAVLEKLDRERNGK